MKCGPILNSALGDRPRRKRSHPWRDAFRLGVVSVIVLIIETRFARADVRDAAIAIWHTAKFSDFVTLLGICVAAVSFWNALRQARHAQIWKSNEFMSAQMAAFMSDTTLRQSLKLLDYSTLSLNLSDDLRGVHVDQHLAAGALIPHWFGPRENVSRVEVAFRDNLDLFIERVDYINDMLKVKLLKFEDIAPYVKYWIERIADPYASLQPDLKRSLWIFIDAYEYHGVQELSRRFGYSIKPSTKDIAALKQEIAEGKWGDAKNTEQTSPAA